MRLAVTNSLCIWNSGEHQYHDNIAIFSHCTVPPMNIIYTVVIEFLFNSEI